MNETDAKGRFVSDCIDVLIDEPGDQTVRPIPPGRIEQARALRDRIQAAEKAQVPIDYIDVFIDEPGDHTVRPIPPERLEQAKALRDQILAAEKQRDS
jgi:hypothetical protein